MKLDLSQPGKDDIEVRKFTMPVTKNGYKAISCIFSRRYISSKFLKNPEPEETALDIDIATLYYNKENRKGHAYFEFRSLKNTDKILDTLDDEFIIFRERIYFMWKSPQELMNKTDEMDEMLVLHYYT
jgi:hypothetical protein